jgi:3-isopropylmalate/(R)-2-methylmalate dehydratase small subunit
LSNSNDHNSIGRGVRGRVHKYDKDNIDTDVIIPGPYLKIHDHRELAKHAMEGIDPSFPQKVSEGDFLVAGNNFYRNAVDGGYLLPIEIDQSTVKRISDGDELEIDITKNQITNITKNEHYSMKPFPELIAKIVEAGGLINYNPND